MYRLLIVDDEPIISDGLYELFRDFEDLELDVYKAYSAPEGLQILEHEKIDIIIADIRMPRMSGIEFLDEVQKKWGDIKFIFLTGHNNFDDAQYALRNEVVDFVLKYEGDRKLIDAVLKAAQEIEKEEDDKELLEQSKRQIKQALPLLREQYLLSLLNGAYIDDVDLRRQFDELKIAMDSDHPVLLIIGRVDSLPDNMSFTQRKELFFNINNIAERFLFGGMKIVQVEDSERSFVWFLQTKDGNGKAWPWQRKTRSVMLALEKVQKAVEKRLLTTVSFLISREPVEWEQAAVRYKHLKNSFGLTNGISRNVIMTDDFLSRSKSEEPVNGNKLSDDEVKYLELLQSYLENGQQRLFEDYLLAYLAAGEKQNSSHYHIVLEKYYSIAVIFLSYMNKNNIEIKAINERCPDLKKLMKLEDHAGWDEVISFFTRLSQALFVLREKSYCDAHHAVIKKINHYVSNNLDGDVTVAKLSDICHFNPSYLSRMYKNMTGKSISEFISSVKLTEAKKMLSTEQVKIAEISDSLGFSNASYFTRFFKKHTGLAPHEYRQQ
jgi:two-component system response regulator YesN